MTAGSSSSSSGSSRTTVSSVIISSYNKNILWIVMLSFFGGLGVLKNIIDTKLCWLHEMEKIDHANNSLAAVLSTTTTTTKATTTATTTTATRDVFTTSKSSSSSSSTSRDIHTHGICALFPKPFTASSLWKSNLDRILQASLLHPTKTKQQQQSQFTNHHQDDEVNEQFKDILYNVLSTERLRKGLRARPSNEYHAVTRVIEILERKLMDDTAPPLTVAVFGGSVTVGRGCDPTSDAIVNRECAWPRKLEVLINQLLLSSSSSSSSKKEDEDVVKIYNMGAGGTNTEQGNIFIKYWMYPEEIREKGPDVIINSYSTNDSSPPPPASSGGSSSGSNSNSNTPEATMIAAIQGVLERTRVGLQQFVRYALLGRPCSNIPPLVVHVDDYIGHQNTESLLGELSYNLGMVQIANWYGTMAVSYPDTIRDIVYQDTTETTFSPPAWIQQSKNNNKKDDDDETKYNIDSHFTYTGHAALTWVVAYSALEVLSNYCDDFDNDDNDTSQNTMRPANTNNITTKPFTIPPPLDETLKLEQVSRKWKEPPTDYEGHSSIDCSDPNNNNNNNNNNTRHQNPCAFTWIAGPLGIFKYKQLGKFMNKYLTSVDHWTAKADMKQGWSNKLGWEATKPNASFSMRVKDLSNSVQVVTIIYMKSYGEKWANSHARFTIRQENDGGDISSSSSTTTTTTTSNHNNTTATTTVVDLFGTHNSTTSISYTERIVLPNPIPKGGALDLQVDLIGGSTFKISGMMFCSW